ATILSQNTSDKNSGPAFARLKQAFPTWDAAADASAPALARQIRAAGIANVKSKRIKNILSHLRRRRGKPSLDFLKRLPTSAAREYLANLPGVGPKTVACVLMFGFGLPVLPVDTHVLRVSIRLGLVPAGTGADKAHRLLQEQVADRLVYPFHALLIEHGRKRCTARRPDCKGCTLSRLCPSAFEV
ncbi:MAG: endonuclease III, partial [Phycisphaerae bacterium]|nr:endonuclease III [Phycisphaerae bacterium]